MFVVVILLQGTVVPRHTRDPNFNLTEFIRLVTFVIIPLANKIYHQRWT